MEKTMYCMLEEKYVSLETSDDTLNDGGSMSVIRGVRIVKCYNEKPLYKPSAAKILVYSEEKKKTDIKFKQPPKEDPIFKEEVIRNVFKK